MSQTRHALVLGGYGLVGRAAMAALEAAGFRVTGLGRSKVAAQAVRPGAAWIYHDITQLSVADWGKILDGVDVVVNAAGALQDGAEDSLRAVHVEVVEALTQALKERDCRLVQISVAGVSPTADSYFFRSKAQGDTVVATEAPDWVILRPVLVLAPDAYGGQGLIRALAGFPGRVLNFWPGAELQTVHVEDVAAAVVRAADGTVESFAIADLTESNPHTLPDVLTATRRWLGLPAARRVVTPPDWLLRGTTVAADWLGHVGWRAPFRSSAVSALHHGLRGDPETWADVGGPRCRSFAESLATLPATRQERLFARAFWILPMAIGALAIFWIASGLMSFAAPKAAMTALEGRGLFGWPAAALVVGGGLLDLALGFALLVRRLARRAAVATAAVALANMLFGLALAPDLWADPMTPMLKLLPVVGLSLIVWLLLEPR